MRHPAILVRMRRVIGVALMVDGLWAVWSMTDLVASFAWREGGSIALITLRALVGMVAVVSGWLVTQRRPPGDALAAWAAVGTAGVVATGLLGRMLPTDLAPSLKTPVVVAYVTAAVVIVLWTRATDATAG